MKITAIQIVSLIFIFYCKSAFPQIISASEPIAWLNSDNFPIVVYESLEDKKFKFKKNLNDYPKPINYVLSNDTSGYQISINDNSEEYDYEFQEIIRLNRSISFLFLGSQKKEYNVIAKQIKETSKLVVVRNDTPKVTIYKKNDVLIRISEGAFAQGIGMYYAIEFYKRK
jgi:hypothetical protein